MYADRLSPSVFAASRATLSCCLSIAMLIFVVGIELLETAPLRAHRSY